MTVSYGDLVRKLVLFDEILIESHNLKEPAALTQKFGYAGVKALFESGRVRLIKDMVWIADLGQMPVRPGGNGKLLPLGSYSIGPSRLTPPRDYHSRQLHKVDEVDGISARQAKRLRRLIGEQIRTNPDGVEQRARDLVLADFEASRPILNRAIALNLKRQFQIDVEPGRIELGLKRLRFADWEAQTNLAAFTSLDAKQIHDAVYGGLAAAATLNVRLVLMEGLGALSGFQNNDLPLYEEKLAFLMRQVDPDVQGLRLDRIAKIGGLPEVSDDPAVDDIDLAKLVDITSGPEAEAFRTWLRTTDSISDEEVDVLLRPVRDIVAKAVRSPLGKSVRFVTAAGVGIVIPPVGIALSAVDTFLLERLIPEPGPIAFLSRLSHSMFH
jgi:hypothetical protein